MTRFLAKLLVITLLFTSPAFAEDTLTKVDKFKGLKRNPVSDKVEIGGHTIFDNVLIEDGNIMAVKGRDRLNSTALTNVTSNGLWYYENKAGTTKKLVRMENTVLASYDTDGTNRAVLNTGLTNEKHRAVQSEDNLYITSDTDGLYKWTGSGAAAAVTGVSTPSNVNFSSTTGIGNLTTGNDAILSVKTQSLSIASTDSTRYPDSSSGCTIGPLATEEAKDSTAYTDTACSSFSTTNWIKSCATSTTYSYKITSWDNISGIEGEPSTADTATLTGADQFDTFPDQIYTSYGGSTTCAASNTTRYRSQGVNLDADTRQSRTTGTLGSTPSAPFTGSCIYRTVAGGTDYFKLGCVVGGASTYTDGKADISLGPPLDTTIDTIDPPSYNFIAEYKGSIFVAQDNLIYFSHLPVNQRPSAEKYWLETDHLTTGSGKPITALKTTANSLLIFTSNRVLELTGFGVGSFRLRTLIEGIGTISQETVQTDQNGDVIFFNGTGGVYKVKTGGQQIDPATGAMLQNGASIEKISSLDLDDVFLGDDDSIVLSSSDYSASHAYYDTDNQLYFLYIGQDCFIYDEYTGQWSHIPAAKFTVSVFRKSPNSLGQGVLIDNLGFMYNNWTGYENGIESGSVTGTITASGNSTLTCASCTFNTTNDGLKGLWVYLDNENGEWRQISSNTATAITVSSAWTTNPIVTDSFYIAYVIPDWKTKQYTMAENPATAQTNFLYLIHEKSAATQTLYYQTYENKSTTAVNAGSIDLSSKFIDKVNIPMHANWVEMEFYSFIYNISNTVDNPINVSAYALKLEEQPEDIT